MAVFRENQASLKHLFKQSVCSPGLKSCAPMEMDRRGLRAGHGCRRGRLVSAAIFLLMLQLAVVAQRSRCCCDVFPPPMCLEGASECAAPIVSVKFTACKSLSRAINKCGAMIRLQICKSKSDPCYSVIPPIGSTIHH